MKALFKNKVIQIILYVITIIALATTIYLCKKFDQNIVLIKFLPIIKFVCYGCVFLPIPACFLRDKIYYTNKWFILITLWSFFISYYWVYATTFLILLLIIPIITIIKKGNNESKKPFPNYGFIFFPLACTSIVVSFITRELIWTFGAATFCAWGLVSIIQKSSLGNIYNLNSTYSNDNILTARKNRASIFYILLFFSLFAFIFLEGKELKYLFSEINSKVIEIYFALLAILVALQSLMNRSYSGNSKREKIFEAKINIESMKAIRGIIITFSIILFLLLITYFFISTSNFKNFTFSFLLWLKSTNSYSEYFDKSILVLYVSLIISICILSIYQIIFVFFSGELVLLPHKMFIKRSSAIIEESSIYGLENIGKLDSIKRSIKNYEPLNGQVIKDLSCITLDFTKPNELIITCKIEVVIPDRTELLNTAISIALCVMKDVEIIKVNVWATAMVCNLDTTKIFSANFDVEKFKQLREKPIYEFSYDEKDIIVKPSFKEYSFKEAYIF